MKSESNIQFSEPTLVASSPEVHYGFPRLVRARNSDLLLFYRVGTTHASDDAVNAMRISDDNGETWSEERVLFRTDPGFSAHNPVALVTPKGDIIFWCSRYHYRPALRPPCHWSRSTDHGRTWSPFGQFPLPVPFSCYYVTEAISIGESLLAGAALFPMSGERSCRVVVLRSHDDGSTWTETAVLARPGDNLGNEAALLQMRSGEIQCILRAKPGDQTHRLWSRDEGSTWSQPESLEEMIGCPLQRPFLTRLNEEEVLLTGRDRAEHAVVVFLSGDGGRTFSQRAEVDSYQVDGGYTAAVKTGPRQALLVWYSDGGSAPLKPDIKSAQICVS